MTQRGIRSGGFTLVELLITLTILVALSAMAAETFYENIEQAKRSVRDANLRAIRKAIQTFYNDHGRYPYNGQDEMGNVVMFLDNNTSELVQGVHDSYGHYPDRRTRYLAEIPVDPMTGKADWLLVPYDNDGDWRSGPPDQQWWQNPPQPGTFNWRSGRDASGRLNKGGDDVDGDGRPSNMHNARNPLTGQTMAAWEGLPEPHVDEDGFGGNEPNCPASPQDEDCDGRVDEDPPDVKDVESRAP